MTQLVLLAGGLGTRSAHYANGLPKALLPVLGKPALHWHLRFAEVCGISSVLVLASHLGEQLADRVPTLAGGCAPHVDVVVEPRPSGTAGALRFASSRLGERFVLGNSDTFIPIEGLRALVGTALRGSSGIGVVRRSSRPNLRLDAEDTVIAYRKEGFPDDGSPSGTDAGYSVWQSADVAAAVADPAATSFEMDCLPGLLSRVNVHGIGVGGFNDFGTEQGYARVDGFVTTQLHHLDTAAR